MLIARDPDVAPDSRFADVEHVRIHFRRSGEGDPLLLLHGSASSLYGVEEVAERLAANFDVIRPDLPGFGVTGPRSDRDYRVATYASTMNGFLDAIGVESAVVGGNSLGGNIAWNMALDDRPRVRALVLINATGYPDKHLPTAMTLARNPVVGQLLRRVMPRAAVMRSLKQAAAPNQAVITDDVVQRAHRLWNRPGNRSAFVDFVSTDQRDRSHQIATIDVPTLVLSSAEMDGQYFARDIAGSVARVRLHGGHLLPQEDPGWVAYEIADFIQSLPVGGAR